MNSDACPVFRSVPLPATVVGSPCERPRRVARFSTVPRDDVHLRSVQVHGRDQLVLLDQVPKVEADADVAGVEIGPLHVGARRRRHLHEFEPVDAVGQVQERDRHVVEVASVTLET
jgi:hypothetical protein